jgi:hypothetical protein
VLLHKTDYNFVRLSQKKVYSMSKMKSFYSAVLTVACGLINSFAAAASSDLPSPAAPAITARHGIEGFTALPQVVQGNLRSAGWLERPSMATVIKSALWVLGPIGLSIYLTRILKKDKQARLLKFKKQQPQPQGDPMAQLMMMMHMQNGGNSVLPDDSADGVLLDQASESMNTDIEVTWNEKDILPSAKRYFLQAIVMALRATALFGVVNCANVLKDCWKGNRVPASVAEHMNAQVDLEKNYRALSGSYERTPQDLKPSFIANIARTNGFKLHKVTSELSSLRDAATRRTQAAITHAQNVSRTSDLCKIGDVTGLTLLGWLARAKGSRKH